MTVDKPQRLSNSHCKMKTSELQAPDEPKGPAKEALGRLDSDLKPFLNVVKKTERIRDLSGEFREFSRSELAISADSRSTKSWEFFSLLVASGFLSYQFIKYLSLVVLHYKLDTISIKLWPTADPKTFYSKCISKHQYNSLITTNLDSYREFIDLEADISRLKPLAPSIQGINSIAYNTTCSLIVFYFFFGLTVIKFVRPKFYVYDFISNRQEERTRFQCEFNALCDSMFICRKIENNEKPVYEYQPRYRVKPTRQFCRIALEHGYNQPNGMDLCDANFMFRLDQKLVYLIDPAHLADRLYYRVLAYINWRVSVRWVVLMVPIFSLIAYGLFIELNDRAIYRLDMIHCQAIDGVPARAPIRLASIESNPHYVAAFRSYNETSPSSFLNLLLIEARFYFTAGVSLSLMEIILSLWILSRVGTFFIELYGYEYGSQMCWLNQIDKQVKRATCDLQDLVRVSNLRFPPGELDRRRNECLKSLSLAYLNYELFRRSQREYRSLTNVLFAQVALTAAQTLFVCYQGCNNIKSSHTSLSLLGATIVGGFLNAFLISGSIRASKALKLMSNVSSIVALSASSCLNQSPIINLWSNQIVYSDETKQLFALKLLGIPISYDNILSLNANIIIMWYILKSN